MKQRIELIVSPPPDLSAQDLDRVAALRSAFAASRARVHAADPESYWFERFGVARQHDWPAAAFRGPARADTYLLCADPVGLAVNGDAVVLDTDAADDLDAAQAAALIAVLNAHFAQDGLTIEAVTPTQWVLALPDAVQVGTTAPRRAHRRSIEALLPQGDDARRLKRIGNEAQMLLHETPVNQARLGDGRAPINGLWLWGGGRRVAVPRQTRALRVFSDTAHVAGLAAASGHQAAHLPDRAAALPDDDNDLAGIVVDLCAGPVDPGE